MEKCFVIAEIGVNHNGDMDLAKKMVLAAKNAGADAVKFQTFTAATLVGKDVPKVQYQKNLTDHKESHYEMIRKLELSRENHQLLFSYCREIQVEFMSTPYDVEGAQFLENLGVRVYKTASADLVDTHLHRFLASTGKRVYASTGMATMGEVEKMLNIYDEVGSRSQVVLLHCVSNYPCKDSSLNLRVIPQMAQAFGVPVGYSDHSEGPLASAVSVALGAVVVEKHFTLDRKLPGPDHKASCEPQEFEELVRQIRMSEEILGSPVKRVQEEEMEMRSVSRKSLTFSRALVSGDVVKASDIVLKRPGTGLPGEFESFFIGKKVRRDTSENDLLTFSDVE